ncbi:putative nuclease HARBI1 [Rhopalosiphum maidis]|uniref:putative nuclease HARBI1 n=1 Tax=Rhopalosiphum maidis TaxID=43146 RepID=UPI000EFEC3A8|nr:putative nuclease HARBI1 [Rhopalosiphum maidis]XP_060846264.1 putative nuclease HARBI1 [Rhopalosiphum padi]
MNGYWMSKPNKDQWKNIAERYESLWNLPNCIGSIDGKHIRIEKLPNTGSSNFNYKAYNSIVLLGCCDADGLFTMVETGYAGRNSDGGIFRASAMKYHITHSQLDIPLPSKLPHDTNNCNFPYYFVADEAFPLSKYLMRPYPRRTLNNIKRVFNYRLSRGRKTIECTFGMMTEKFQVLSTAIRCRDVDKINNIVKACCILHNFIRKREGIRYAMRNFEESVDLRNTNNFTTEYSTSNEKTVNDQSSCYDLRDYLSRYFTTPQASLPWQWNNCI